MNKVIIPLALTMMAPYALAEEATDAPDPGDHTKVSTMVGATYGVASLSEENDNFFRLNAQMSGAKNNGNLFLGQLQFDGREDQQFDDSFDLTQVRARYFEVKRTGYESVSVAGVSLDYIESSFVDTNPTDRLLAVGGIVRVATPFANWLAFPILAGVYAQNDKAFSDASVVDKNAWGVQVNMMNSVYLHENGTHLQFNPQYSMVDMGGMLGTVNSLQLDTALQFPMTDNRKHWGKITYIERFSDATQSFGHVDTGRELLFSYNYYL
ncbi:hypothetical protein L4D20_06105 [Vibrio kyushuensis]|uniref:hypothetical protein n=1 Tax=Vibrio kyushuensis TaxID=2910249 RepID=UPI003D1505D5